MLRSGDGRAFAAAGILGIDRVSGVSVIFCSSSLAESRLCSHRTHVDHRIGLKIPFVAPAPCCTLGLVVGSTGRRRWAGTARCFAQMLHKQNELLFPSASPQFVSPFPCSLNVIVLFASKWTHPSASQCFRHFLFFLWGLAHNIQTSSKNVSENTT